jgi:hypothetical protein
MGSSNNCYSRLMEDFQEEEEEEWEDFHSNWIREESRVWRLVVMRMKEDYLFFDEAVQAEHLSS